MFFEIKGKNQDIVNKRVQQTPTAKKFPTLDRRFNTSIIPNYDIYLVYKFSPFFHMLPAQHHKVNYGCSSSHYLRSSSSVP